MGLRPTANDAATALIAIAAFAAVVAMVRPPVSLDKADASAWGNADPRGLQDVITLLAGKAHYAPGRLIQIAVPAGVAAAYAGLRDERATEAALHLTRWALLPVFGVFVALALATGAGAHASLDLGYSGMILSALASQAALRVTVDGGVRQGLARKVRFAAACKDTVMATSLLLCFAVCVGIGIQMDLLSLTAAPAVHGRISVVDLAKKLSLDPTKVSSVAALVVAIQVVLLPAIDVAMAVHAVVGGSDGSLEPVRRRLRTLAALDVFVAAVLLAWSSFPQVGLEPAFFLFVAAAICEWGLHMVACNCSQRVKLATSAV